MQKFQHCTGPQTVLVSRISDTGSDVPDLAYCLQLGGLGRGLALTGSAAGGPRAAVQARRAHFTVPHGGNSAAGVPRAEVHPPP